MREVTVSSPLTPSVTYPERQGTAEWLEVVDISALIAHAQANGASPDMPWLDGIMPVNHWVAAFERSLSNPEEWDQLHICIVNTKTASTLTLNAQGQHWIVIAWWVEKDE